MRFWKAAAAAGLLGAAGIAAWAAPIITADDDPQVKSDANANRERAKDERELAGLEAQRAKLDQRILELRRKMGLSEGPRVFAFGKAGADVQVLDDDQKREIGRAVADARRAAEDATRNLPDLKFIIPNPEKLFDGQFRAFSGPDGKDLHWDKLSPEQRDKLKKEMRELRGKMRGRSDEIRVEVERMRKDLQRDLPKLRELRELPGALAAPSARGGDSELRLEIERLRDEIRQLREEVRSGRGKGASNGGTDQFDLL